MFIGRNEIKMEEIKEKFWERIKDKKRIVVKVGSSTLTHKDTGNLNYTQLEKIVRALSDLKNSGKDVILVSSGAVACRKRSFKNRNKTKNNARKTSLCSSRTRKINDE